MKQYIGTKIIHAEPAFRVSGLDKTNIVYPKPCPVPLGKENEDWEDGYKGIYPDGYESWSPRDVFEAAYRETNGMNFGLAIEAAKMGKKIARAGWNGKGMYVFLANDVEFHTDADISEFEGAADGVFVADMLVMRTAQGNMQPGWLASQADMLADDWYIVE